MADMYNVQDSDMYLSLESKVYICNIFTTLKLVLSLQGNMV